MRRKPATVWFARRNASARAVSASRLSSTPSQVATPLRASRHRSTSVESVAMCSCAPSVSSITLTNARALCWKCPTLALTIARFSQVCQLFRICFVASRSATCAASKRPRRMLSAATLFHAWPFSASACVHRTNALNASSSLSAFNSAYPQLNHPSGNSGFRRMASDQYRAARGQSSLAAAPRARERHARAARPSETKSAFS
mmetsp:Transcript_15627/g.65873  ORF Transcript_15627/g.65873 Transcript_15627/m.65873 type:complete len:202 (-) Transcript_15627:1315-1920(-)